MSDKITLFYSLLEKKVNTSGFIVFYFDNKSKNKVDISLIFTDFRGVRVIENTLIKNTVNIKVNVKSSKSVILQCIDYSYNVHVQFETDWAYSYNDEQIISKYKNDNEKSTKITLEDGLYFYKIIYNYGILLLFENSSVFKYKCSFRVTNLQNLQSVKGKLEDNNNFDIKANGQVIYQFKAINRLKKVFLEVEKGNIKSKKV